MFDSPAKSLLSSDVCGEHVRLCPPVARVERFVKHYLKCKSWSPHDVSACIVVPAFRSAKWRRLLQDMRLLKQYAQGSMLVADAGHASSQVLRPAPWDYKVYYDPPVTGHVQLASPLEMFLHAACDAGQFLMSFPGVVSDQPACVVAAESAAHAFTDHAFVLKQGLCEYGTSGSVSAAGQKGVPSSSFVRQRGK